MAHGIFEELRSKDLILRICPHGARPLRTRGNRPPRALIAFREKPPSFRSTRACARRAETAPSPFSTASSHASSASSSVPCSPRKAARWYATGYESGKRSLATSNALRASSMRPDSSSVFARPQFPFCLLYTSDAADEEDSVDL